MSIKSGVPSAISVEFFMASSQSYLCLPCSPSASFFVNFWEQFLLIWSSRNDPRATKETQRSWLLLSLFMCTIEAETLRRDICKMITDHWSYTSVLSHLIFSLLKNVLRCDHSSHINKPSVSHTNLFSQPILFFPIYDPRDRNLFFASQNWPQ